MLVEAEGVPERLDRGVALRERQEGGEEPDGRDGVPHADERDVHIDRERLFLLRAEQINIKFAFDG